MDTLEGKQEIGKGVVEIRNLEIKEMHDWVLCPISYCIFKNPVIAEDGHIYEHDSIFRWFTNCREGFTGITSPLTKEQLNTSRLIPCQMARQMVDMYLNLYPEKKINQYTSIFNMKTFMHYLHHSVMGCEQYMRNVENFSMEEISFYELQKCVKIFYNQEDPLLRKSLWEGFFKKIEDIHAPFKLEHIKKPSGYFSYEDDMETNDSNTRRHTLQTVPTNNPIRVPTYEPRAMTPDFNDEEEEDTTNAQFPRVIPPVPSTSELRLALSQVMGTEEQEQEQEDDIPNLIHHFSQLTVDDSSPSSSNAQSTPSPMILSTLRVNMSAALNSISNFTNSIAIESAWRRLSSLSSTLIYPEVISASTEEEEIPPFDSEESGEEGGQEWEERGEEREEELEEGEIREERNAIHTQLQIQSPLLQMISSVDRFIPRNHNRLLQDGQSVVKHKRKTLLGCLCFHGNKKILETFLNFMPPISSPSIAEKYQHLLEEFIKKNIKLEKIKTMNKEGIDLLQNVLSLMLDKGIPYHHWTKDGKQTVLSFMYFALNPYYPSFSKLQKKIIHMPEFLCFPPSSPEQESYTPKQLFVDVLSKTENPLMALQTWEIYQKNQNVQLEDIWEFCVNYSEFNIWHTMDKITHSASELLKTLLISFVKARVSIPMDLILIKIFKPSDLIYLFIEGYDIEVPEKKYEFPCHEHLLPPIIPEEILNYSSKNPIPRFSHTESPVLADGSSSVTTSHPWKVTHNSNGGRLKISRRRFSTNWTRKMKEENGMIQLPPYMSVLGWLIHHYQPAVAFQYLSNHKEKVINVNSNDFTGLEYIEPIHLLFRYHEADEQSMELLKEMLRRDASLKTRTSHGWLPIHYACRYSFEYIPWLIENVPSVEVYLNEPLCIQPSIFTKYISNNRDWDKTYYPLDIYEQNYMCINHISSDYTSSIYENMVNAGAKTLLENKPFHKIPFTVDTPLTFHMGSCLHPETNNVKKTTKRKRTA